MRQTPTVHPPSLPEPLKTGAAADPSGSSFLGPPSATVIPEGGWASRTLGLGSPQAAGTPQGKGQKGNSLGSHLILHAGK